MPTQVVNTPYPVIDADPHAKRVIRYMRPSDYAVWAGATATFPALLYGYEMADPTRLTKKGITPALKLCTFLGFCGGFLLAYQRSSFRFWGWEENAREEKKDMEELSALAAQGKPVYGHSDLPEYIQGVAHRNSVWSQLKFAALPWFNLVNHNNHGVDTTKYYLKAQEQQDN
ncbi:NUXm, NADH-ubiquinone oxidoreductase [Cystobasidium minutum MCA 4210]|uniref:NUXm, NADH-ubiquinone oxidoreductase n=1 Tax=Cystobasidium minutum MCA 4210 TaxID=1397322 RepID=UPI0034CFEF71|eukprot:jgi/Rhomi1/154112/estExt_Genewise1.C_5_t20123